METKDRSTTTKRCPDCGGLNHVDADWCGQCLKRFSAPPAPEPAPDKNASKPQAVGFPSEAQPAAQAEPIPAASPPTPGKDAPAATQKPQVPPEAVGSKRGAFEVTDEGITWTCGSCDSKNPIDATTCSVCGAPFARTLKEPETAAPARDANTTAMISLFMPGAGHAYLGQWGQAIARGVISLWVVATAMMLAVNKNSSVVMTGIFALAAVAMWALSAHDSYREARGESQMALIKGRAFLYIVLGLLALLVFQLVGAGLGAR